jgi:hypothetical protein
LLPATVHLVAQLGQHDARRGLDQLLGDIEEASIQVSDVVPP